MQHPRFNPIALDVYDVYIVNDHGVELKAKAPLLIGYDVFRNLNCHRWCIGACGIDIELSSCTYASLIKMNPTSYAHSN